MSNIRQKIHVDIRKSDLDALDAIAEELDLARTQVLRLAVIEYIRNHAVS